MKSFTVLLICLGGLMFAFFPPQNSGWRGIVPLRSTRADVERLIGRPNFRGNWDDFKGERASIMYTREPCSGGMQGACDVPRDTVRSIDVVPRKLTLPQLNLDPGEYEKSGGTPDSNIAIYHSEKAGITYEVFEGGEIDGKIRTIIYGPKADDARLHCPVAPGQADADNDPEAQSADAVPLGECPRIDIDGSSVITTQPGVYFLSANVSGGDPRFTPAYKWSVSAGVIASGQATSLVKLDTNGINCRLITVTLEVGGIIPNGCQRVKTYTIERSKPE